jgi:hypothetical protein
MREAAFTARTCRPQDGRVAIIHLRSSRRAKARDFASPASLASPTAPSRCQQMICVGDAKRGTARGLRHPLRLLRHQLVSLCRSHHVSGLIRLGDDAVLCSPGSSSFAHRLDKAVSGGCNRYQYVPVAQLDRASASGAEGYRFNSCRAYCIGWAHF